MLAAPGFSQRQGLFCWPEGKGDYERGFLTVAGAKLKSSPLRVGESGQRESPEEGESLRVRVTDPELAGSLLPPWRSKELSPLCLLAGGSPSHGEGLGSDLELLQPEGWMEMLWHRVVK